MHIKLSLYPGGKTKALTMSYDDGTVHDRRLVDIFNRYGIKSTFHLNSGFFGKGGYLEEKEIADLFRGHEISVHTSTHPHLHRIPRAQAVTELMTDRAKLERLAGYPIRGMSYPYGTYNEAVVHLLEELGMVYSRTVASTGEFTFPERPLTWHPTCHHRDMAEMAEAFLNYETLTWRAGLPLLYVWGHSYEFNNNNNWDDMERFCERMAGREDIWYATNIELIEYKEALDRLQCSAEGTLVRNPSAIPVWVQAGEDPVEIGPGQTVRIRE